MDDSLKIAKVGDYELFYRDPEAYQHVLRAGMGYEPHVVRELFRLLPSSPGFLDIGSNHGIYVAIAKMIMGPDYPVTAIEVNPANTALIIESIKHNKWKNTYVASLGLWSKPGWKWGNTCWNATVYENKPDEVRYLCLPLDALPIPEAHVVKLDCEGAELFILRGMTQFISECHPVLLVEYSLGGLANNQLTGLDLLEFFPDHNYRLTVLDYKPGMRKEFITPEAAVEHIAQFTTICDVMATWHG